MTPEAKQDAANQMPSERRRFGYRLIHVMLERQGIVMNQQKLRRLYSTENLQVRKRSSGDCLQSPRGESFNGSFRDECLNETLLPSLAEGRNQFTTWKDDYNIRTLHSSFGNITPNEFAMKMAPENESHEIKKEITDYYLSWKECGPQITSRSQKLIGPTLHSLST